MKKSSQKIALTVTSLLMIQAVYADIPNNEHPTAFVGPIARGSFTSLITDTSGVSFAGEGGMKNFRLSGTLGLDIFEGNQFKFTGEYLWQKDDFAFFSGTKDKWATQGALGAAYQYRFSQSVRLNPTIGVSAYYSAAPATAMGTEDGQFVNSAGVLEGFSDTQRISPSSGAGIAPGFTIQPWRGGTLGFDLNYDDVRYDMKYESDVSTEGLGGTAHFNQFLTRIISVGATAAVRKPYNNYQANITLNNMPYFGPWDFRLFGDYTIGKKTLSNTYNIGLSADYFMDRECINTAEAEQAKNEFLSWMAKPAVYMPQVLSLADDGVTTFPIL